MAAGSNPVLICNSIDHPVDLNAQLNFILFIVTSSKLQIKLQVNH